VAELPGCGVIEKMCALFLIIFKKTTGGENEIE